MAVVSPVGWSARFLFLSQFSSVGLLDFDTLKRHCVELPHSSAKSSTCSFTKVVSEGERLVFCISEDNDLFRLDRYWESPSSLLTSHGVIQGLVSLLKVPRDFSRIAVDGSIYFVTPVDVLFLVLSLLETKVKCTSANCSISGLRVSRGMENTYV